MRAIAPNHSADPIEHGLAVAVQVNSDDARALGLPLDQVLLRLAEAALGAAAP